MAMEQLSTNVFLSSCGLSRVTMTGI
uniref:Uncharacterized protein n=1 Tax=Biomphalaria glabrata TaxID=6526 RepID=A0A182YU41_BIOGL